MTPAELRQEIGIEFSFIRRTLEELEAIQRDVAGREPTTRELAAAGLFLANLYTGIENVLKRICRFYEVTLLSGGDWHLELFQSFCIPPRRGLPLLLDSQLAATLAPYRQFRHVIHHGYGFRPKWMDMLPGVEGATDVFAAFQSAVDRHLAAIAAEGN